MKRKSQVAFSQIKTSLFSYLSATKGRLIVISLITVMCFVAGIIIFCLNKASFLSNENILSISGIKTGLGAFFSRSLSIVIVFGVCFLCSFNAFTTSFAVLIVGFRGYLLGYNICLLCSHFGMSGLIQTIFIVLPCQLAILALMVLFICFISKASANCKKFGSRSESRGKLFLIFLLLSLIIDVVETLLLCIFSSNIILVI